MIGRIGAGGPCDASESVMEGDLLLSVDGFDVRSAALKDIHARIQVSLSDSQDQRPPSAPYLLVFIKHNRSTPRLPLQGAPFSPVTLELHTHTHTLTHTH